MFISGVLVKPVTWVTTVSIADMDLSVPKNRDVKIAIERTLLGWLVAVTGKTSKEVMFNLYDMSNTPLQKLLKRSNGSFSHNKIKYPGTEITLLVKANMYTDTDAYYKKCREYQDLLSENKQGNIVTANFDKEHPRPTWNDPEFNFIRCSFTLPKDSKEILFSKDEMETMMTENILLGADDE